MKAYFDSKPVEIISTMVYPAPYIQHRTGSFVNLNINGGGVLKIECDETPETVNIRPRRFNIDYRIVGKVIEIPIDTPRNFSVELNGDCNRGLMVFAAESHEAEEWAYDNVITIKRGRHFVGEIKITKDNTLVYFENGAYADGKIFAENCNNLTIAGNGIISMENYCRSGGSYGALKTDGCSNVQIRDITVIDSCNWSVCISGCDNVTVDNCKIIGQRGNSDGIDVCGSRNVHVKNCFTRVWDDSLVVKAFNTGDVSDILFENCVLWNDFARPIEVGVELRAEKVHGVHFKNIDIIHSPTGYPLMGIHHGDRADVYDISFENINVEDSPSAQIFDIRITDSVWNTDKQKGRIHDILFKDINVAEICGKALSPSRIHGYAAGTCAENVTIENVRICGAAARNARELNLITNEYAKNISFKADAPPYINLVKTHIETKDDFVFKNGYYEGVLSVVAENVSEECVQGDCRLEVKPSHRAKVYGDNFCFSLKPHQKAEHDYKVILPPGKFVIEVQSGNEFVRCDWSFKNFPMILSDDIVLSPEYTVSNCFGNIFGEVKFALKNELLIIKSELLKTNAFNVYLAKPTKMREGEVMFSVEETDCANAPAIINGVNGSELAPQLRCPAEITYVFKNEPKVEKIEKISIQPTLTGESYITVSKFDVTDEDGIFWLELEIETDTQKRYPLCLFGSQQPDSICHMFVNVQPNSTANSSLKEM